jgi:hypothetical protein
LEVLANIQIKLQGSGSDNTKESQNEKQILEGLANIQRKLHDMEETQNKVQDNGKRTERTDNEKQILEVLANIQIKLQGSGSDNTKESQNEKQILEGLEKIQRKLHDMEEIQNKMQDNGKRTERTDNEKEILEVLANIQIKLQGSGSENTKESHSNKHAEGVSHENEKPILEGLENIQRKLQDIKERMPNTNTITCACTPNSEEMKTKMQEIGARTKSTEAHMKLTEEQVKLILHALAGIHERIPITCACACTQNAEEIQKKIQEGIRITCACACTQNGEEIQTKMQDIGERIKRVEEHMKLVWPHKPEDARERPQTAPRNNTPQRSAPVVRIPQHRFVNATPNFF